ncbi:MULTISPECIES: ribosome small subunit-dependent GTPase A [Prochlorococcus]|uniref:Small ribosomal subunit biogenesis GTPase RsgA n=1 Tax=Prochlorococcus marinus (strain SARG / CCMP1375 / SS120) TaxID=167539 RepID=RSGA_PROMA|nr:MULTISPECIES: ribosome small subunit-dependent GTPase A [Prochlorococcus]Q7VEJ4.1 RecName: Full=Small ribosomal subunit biogenesis GTPase RsgA [Prochlorococcus marinus subsp. marinus str. CCMP1375]AAP99065.1 Predicted GTPase [Prochlorococcus marinus subsp. marinus str. CCMP1375]KGG11679.1 Ribosome small subunit-stimulated GTPase EngC [Prochlorococcus marinus str. LG]KGG22313.1 Ribosome small subunit-stimulated GTPase EngC [Prochlorococcus marinus str. SS2]KGG22650.1 Ribosome small subunit-s
MLEINKDRIKGIVLALKANYYIVQIDTINLIPELFKKKIGDHNFRLLCTKRSRLSYKGHSVSVGDFVLIEAIDWTAETGVISFVEPRKNLITRPPVANVTDVIIVVSLLDPSFDLNQVSRFLMKAEETGLKVTIVLTKRDLIDEKILEKYDKKLQTWGYQPIPISIVNGEGIQKLSARLKSMKLGVLCGPSGVGKSSLINYLLPKISIPIGKLSKKLKRGRHTTRHVELFSIYSDSFIADTPGFNKPEFYTEPSQVPQLFPELRSQLLIKKCKFRNCMHLNEPDCAISRDWERYSNYKNFLQEMLNYHH